LKDILLLVMSLAIILSGAEVFTNGVEWLGKKLKLGEGAVGSILAAVGTALPETLIPVIAIFTGTGSGGEEVGVGAILGAPFMLGTLALFILGVSVFFFRHSNRPMYVHSGIICRDLRFFIIVYSLAVIASFVQIHSLKMLFVVVLTGAYLFYVYQTVRSSYGSENSNEAMPSFYLSGKKNREPGLSVITLQVGIALLIIVLGAKIFADSVQNVALASGIPVLILSLIITPVATELPEKFNSVLWACRGKDALAMGNITGAMVFQSSVIPALGIALTPWILEPIALACAVLAILSALVQYMLLSRKKNLFPAGLLLGGAFYAVFMFLVFRSFLV